MLHPFDADNINLYLRLPCTGCHIHGLKLKTEMSIVEIHGLHFRVSLCVVDCGRHDFLHILIELLIKCGIAIAGGTMLWGGELTEFGRRACMIGLVVSVLVFAAPMLSSAFGGSAAVG